MFGSTSAQQLPVKTYTSADGLAQNNVNRILVDSRGFLWFATREGLSRFDGYKFTTYNVDHGLPHNNLADVVESPLGGYWLATNNGISYFNPQGRPVKTPGVGKAALSANSPMFTTFTLPGFDRPLHVRRILADRKGVIWCGTEDGLLRLDRLNDLFELKTTELWRPKETGFRVESLLEDRQGVIWAGAYGRVYRRLPSAAWEEYTEREGLPKVDVAELYEDREGRIWAGTGQGLLQLHHEPKTGQSIVKRTFTSTEGLPGNWVRDLWQDQGGVLWIATDRGLCKYLPSASGQKSQFTVFNEENGLSDYFIKQIEGDRYGNLWIGTANSGVMRLFNDGFFTFGNAEGVLAVVSVVETRSGETSFMGYVSASQLGGRVTVEESKLGQKAFLWRIGKFKGDQLVWFRPNIPQDVNFSFGWNQISFQDRGGEWWIATRDGLYRFPKLERIEDLERAKPGAVYKIGDGLTSNQISRLFEDSRGDVWIATRFPPARGLARLDRKTGVIHNLIQAEGASSLQTNDVTSLGEDRAGNVWIGLDGSGGLLRYHNGSFDSFTTGDGLPAGSIFDLFFDRGGRLWIASVDGGLGRMDDPNSERPKFIIYTTAQGLSSNRVTCVTEDQQGRIYIGTGRGVDRLDLGAGVMNIRHFNQADGLTSGGIDDIFRDKSGNLWLATTKGLSRLMPRGSSFQLSPPVIIDRLRVHGQPHPISALGAAAMTLPPLDSGDNQIEIEFAGLSFAPGDSLRYQYKLEGADNDWSAATEQRTVNYANLAPGDYRFLVRAINSDGVMSERLATVSFTILRPFYLRWWFMVLAVLSASGLFYVLYRYRVAQLIEMERMRTRIATDLHDDIGSNLSRIAMLTEVALQRISPGDPEIKERLSSVAGISRESIDALGDIVWAINPARDRLSDLIQRMRRVADDFCTARGLDCNFRSNILEHDAKLNADTRREVLMIFKECLNNIARHSGGAAVEVEFDRHGEYLILQISDDGRGIEPESSGYGHGLASMSQRAKKLGAELKVTSEEGKGTTVRLEAPLRTRSHRWKNYVLV